MNKPSLTLTGALFFCSIAHAGQADAQAMKKCNDEATAQGLVDQAERKTFITQCLMRETRNDSARQDRPRPGGTAGK